MLLIIKASSKGLYEHNEVAHSIEAQLLQEASHSLKSGTQKFCCDEARLLLLASFSPRTDAALVGLLLLQKQQEPRSGALI